MSSYKVFITCGDYTIWASNRTSLFDYLLCGRNIIPLIPVNMLVLQIKFGVWRNRQCVGNERKFGHAFSKGNYNLKSRKDEYRK